MGQQNELEEAILFLAISFRPEVKMTWLEKEILSQFGIVKECTKPFEFDHSQYYRNEMGDHLKKVFLFFKGFYPVPDAAETKLQSNALEQKYITDSGRSINLDPGYITLAKLVLTTTKNFDHRIHIASGIYGDIQLRYRRGEYIVNPWTYPDYKDANSIEFILKARTYLQKLVKDK
ncbi:MAG: DUF4416 family protein [Calditrichaeota bacterium]|nr:MAG: DUF4416 family protein [Calditrichota bacterium]